MSTGKANVVISIPFDFASKTEKGAPLAALTNSLVLAC
jgi:hypothetical protein